MSAPSSRSEESAIGSRDRRHRLTVLSLSAKAKLCPKPMPFDISFESNLRAWTASMNAVEREQVPFATVMALTWTGQDVKQEHVRLLPLVFDRPTRFTMNSLQLTPATKHSPVARVWFKYSSRHRGHYLLPQVQGGGRPHKRFEYWLIQRGLMLSDEFAVPAQGLKLDAFGNISSGAIVQILSQLAASPDATQWETKRSKRRAGVSRARYFVPQPGSSLPRGVWSRLGKRVEPVLIFVKTARYAVRYRFFDISRRTAEARMPVNFDAAMKRALATAR